MQRQHNSHSRRRVARVARPQEAPPQRWSGVKSRAMPHARRRPRVHESNDRVAVGNERSINETSPADQTFIGPLGVSGIDTEQQHELQRKHVECEQLRSHATLLANLLTTLE